MKGPKPKIFVGDVFETNFSGNCRVVDYSGIYSITVEFEDGYITETSSAQLLKGTVKNPYHPRVFGVGYIGVGKYSAGSSGKISKVYNTWTAMMARCYYKANQPDSYKECSVCEHWHSFQNFGECFDANYVEGFDLDKDLLKTGNMVYSPDTCCFLPRKINNLFRRNRADKYDNLPVGVTLSKSGRYQAKLDTKHLGIFETVELAVKTVGERRKMKLKELFVEFEKHLSGNVQEKLRTLFESGE